MANEQKAVFGSPTTVISLTASVADGNVAGGTTELDNSTDLYPMAKASLHIPDGFGAAPDDLSLVELWMRENDVDGTDDDLGTPSGTSVKSTTLVTAFVIHGTDEAQRNTKKFSIFGTKKAHFWLRNKCGQTLSYSSNPITVKVTPYTSGT